MTDKKLTKTPEERAVWKAKMDAAKAAKRAAAAAESTVVVEKPKPKPKTTAAKPLRKPAPALDETPPKDEDDDSGWLL